MDLLIRFETKGEKSLDDVMRLLYQDYAVKKQGISWDIVRQAVESVAGSAGVDFMNTYIAQANPIPIEMLLEYAGLEMAWKEGDKGDDTPKKDAPFAPNPGVSLGITTKQKNDIVTVASVKRDANGWEAGLDFDDEIIAINGRRLKGSNFDDILSWSRPGDEVTVLVNRAGKIQTIPVKLAPVDKKLTLKQRDNPGTLDTKIYIGLFGAPKAEKADTEAEKQADGEKE